MALYLPNVRKQTSKYAARKSSASKRFVGVSVLSFSVWRFAMRKEKGKGTQENQKRKTREENTISVMWHKVRGLSTLLFTSFAFPIPSNPPSVLEPREKEHGPSSSTFDTSSRACHASSQLSRSLLPLFFFSAYINYSHFTHLFLSFGFPSKRSRGDESWICTLFFYISLL